MTDKQAPPGFEPEDLVLNDHGREVVKGNQSRSMVWIYSPAQLQLLSVARKRLLKVAELRDMQMEQVLKVRGALVKSKKQIFIYPVKETDPDGIEIKSYGSGSAVWINLISLLGGTNLMVPTGYRDRYQAVIADKDQSPVGPSLTISLSRRLERRTKPGKKEDAATNTAAPTREQQSKAQPAPDTAKA